MSLSITELEAKFEKARNNYWRMLVEAGDPDAVSKHDIFCANLEMRWRAIMETMRKIEELREASRQMVMNATIADMTGDNEEFDQIFREFDEVLRTHKHRPHQAPDISERLKYPGCSTFRT